MLTIHTKEKEYIFKMTLSKFEKNYLNMISLDATKVF